MHDLCTTIDALFIKQDHDSNSKSDDSVGYTIR